MSRLRVFNRNPTESSPTVSEIATPMVAQHHVLIEAVPVPVGTNEYDPWFIWYLVKYTKEARHMHIVIASMCISIESDRP